MCVLLQLCLILKEKGKNIFRKIFKERVHPKNENSDITSPYWIKSQLKFRHPEKHFWTFTAKQRYLKQQMGTCFKTAKATT